MEFVWVVRRSELFPRATPYGFVSQSAPGYEPGWLETCLVRGFYVERREAELRSEWKQVIPYCVVDTPDGILCVERLARGSEKRLSGMLSIGIGGHIEPGDADAEHAHADLGLIGTAARREICEELELDEVSQFELLGLINDDTNPVGSVHVGIALRTRVDFVPRVRESDRLAARPTPLVKLQGMCHAHREFETWSRFVLDFEDSTSDPMKIG